MGMTFNTLRFLGSLALLGTVSLVGAVAQAGIDDSGGGSRAEAGKFVGVSLETRRENLSERIRPLEAYRSELLQSAKEGIASLRHALTAGYRFQSAENAPGISLSEATMIDAEKMIDVILDPKNPRLALNPKLSAVIDGISEPRLAVNFPELRQLELNPVEWDLVTESFKPEITAAIHRAFATHEILSLVGLEKTGNYRFSQHFFPLDSISGRIHATIDEIRQIDVAAADVARKTAGVQFFSEVDECSAANFFASPQFARKLKYWSGYYLDGNWIEGKKDPRLSAIALGIQSGRSPNVSDSAYMLSEYNSAWNFEEQLTMTHAPNDTSWLQDQIGSLRDLEKYILSARGF